MTCCCGSPLLHLQWRRWKACHMELDYLSPVSWSTLTPRTASASSALLLPRVRQQQNISHEFAMGQTLLIAVEMANVKTCLNFINMLCAVLSEETSGSEEETMHYYSPASDLGPRSRKKKKTKAQSKTSQSLFSVILSVNHGLMALQTNAKVNLLPFLISLTILADLFRHFLFYG